MYIFNQTFHKPEYLPLLQATLAMEVDEPGPSETTESLYMFEGTDYSKEPSADDKKAFETLVTGKSQT